MASRSDGRRLDELRSIQRDAETIFKKDQLESLFARTQVLATRYGDDKEFSAAAEALHVTRYVVKPFTLAMIMHVGQILKDVLATHAQAKHTAR